MGKRMVDKAGKPGAPGEKFDDYLMLNGRELPIATKNYAINELSFYLENPRLYSVVRSDGKEPTQSEVMDTLRNMDHVKQLVVSISAHGGLIDPVIVHGNIVLEGNSRFAAYQILAEKDPVRWGKIRARVLPKDIEEADIFSLLGEYHVHGKKDWQPYEQAGYLYRRHKKHSIEIPQLVKEIKLPKSSVEHLIAVYQFMLTHDEPAARWSYYDEFLKGRKIAALRNDHGAGFDALVVKKIRSGEVPTAMSLREGLRTICKVGGVTAHKFATGKTKFKDAWEIAAYKGASKSGLQRLKVFRVWLAKAETEKDILALDSELRKQCEFDLRQMGKRIDSLLKKLDKASA